MKTLNILNIDNSSCLFLDRDGVINQRLPGEYVTKPQDFIFLNGVKEAMQILADIFPIIVIVTNQQGIGKNIFTEKQLYDVHQYLLLEIAKIGGRIDKIYYATELQAVDNKYRKPAIGMALQAKKDFPLINFEKSYMVGDSNSDIEFGKRIGATTIRISGKHDELHSIESDFQFATLLDFAKSISK